jgi:hypothetical protein
LKTRPPTGSLTASDWPSAGGSNRNSLLPSIGKECDDSPPAACV